MAGIRLPPRGATIEEIEDSQEPETVEDVDIPADIANDPKFHQLLTRFGRAVQDRDLERQLPGKAPIKEEDVLPGFCYYVALEKSVNGASFIYVNVTHSGGIPDAQLPSSDELVTLLEDPAASMKLPILVGDVRQDTENGKPCGIIDVCVATKVVERASRDPVYRHAIALLALDWVEDRAPELDFDRGTIRVVPVPFKGKLSKHFRRHALVSDMPAPAPSAAPAAKPLSAAKENSKPTSLSPPTLTIANRPGPDGTPHIVLEVHLVRLASADNLIVELDEERLYVDAGREYHWSCRLPSDFDGAQAAAKFVKSKRLLRVSAPAKRA